MKIAVFFGGKSSEHDISIITALQTINAIDKEKFKIIPIYITKQGEWFTGEKLFFKQTYINFDKNGLKKVALTFGNQEILIKGLFNKKVKIDCAVLCLHGLNGEDGTIQGALELAEIPYTSSNVLGSSICMDKIIMKQLFKQNNLPIIDYVWFTRDEFEKSKENVLKKIYSSIDYPYIVKPANLGSSIGITKCECEDDLISAIEVACEYDSRIIVEKAIINLREINCACIGADDFVRTSKLEEPISWNKFLSFKDKYLTFSKNSTSKEPQLLLEQIEIIKDYSTRAFKGLCQSGVVRIDFILDETSGNIFINEINSIPGSMANYLFDEHFGKLIEELIDIAIQKKQEREKNKFGYKSTALFDYVNRGNLGIKK